VKHEGSFSHTRTGVVFEQVCLDLENEGYEVWPVVLPACGKDAPHRRDRVWFIVHSKLHGYDGISITKGQQLIRRGETRGKLTPSINGGTPSHSRLQRQEVGRIDAMGAEQLREERVITNPADGGWERGGTGFEVEKGLQQGPESAGKLEGRFEGLRQERDASDTELSGLEREKTNGLMEWNERPEQRNIFNRNTWENFPTQPPVRGRNDGIFPGLVGITVSKHRNESIKAYGNAIVPAVAYEIFKAIQLTDAN